MSVSMIGIDHTAASVDVRARFSFTRKEAGEAMEKIHAMEGIDGCILLSTCNRMELWVSAEEEMPDLYEILCSLKAVDRLEYNGIFVQRTDREAVKHLFYLTAGLKSQILGEDQILTQVKDALNLAREHFAADGVLEVLFRMAVTAGKKIKTEVPVSHGNPSVIHQALKYLEKKGFRAEGKTCMVIGNGEMGKVAAQTLREAGGKVTVTVRQYRSGVVNIPRGCDRINYGDRMEYLPVCDLVVSATASPNYTLTRELLKEKRPTGPQILIDLAVPRDIDPAIGNLENITLYDMDSFRTDETDEALEQNLKAASRIVEEQMDEFYLWLEGRDIIPRIQEIRQEAVRDLNLRIAKIFRNTPMDDVDRCHLEEAVAEAAGKVVNKLIFGLRDSLNTEAFLECVSGLEKLYEE
ncbi:MAG: glutamyl-tRNA reductase [Blautia sp.]|nr:glutamyl-tRNA reductase [Blautia sp.]MDY5032136.1 glutamyl-tRNA reductase [Blautia sp.]